MTCRDTTELSTAYLDGDLRFMQKLRMALHLGRCDGCRNHLQQIRVTTDALGSLPEEAVSQETRDQLLAAYREREGQSAAVVALERKLDPAPWWSLAGDRRHLMPALRWTLILGPVLVAVNHGLCLFSSAYNQACAVQSFATALIIFAVFLGHSVTTELRSQRA